MLLLLLVLLLLLFGHVYVFRTFNAPQICLFLCQRRGNVLNVGSAEVETPFEHARMHACARALPEQTHAHVPYCHITPPLPRLQGDELTVMVHFLQMDFEPGSSWGLFENRF